MQQGFRALGLVALIVCLHACGGGGMGGSSSPSAPEVVSIAVTPANPTVPAGMTAQFVATATYSDNSTQDVTSSAEWSSSSLASATVNSATGKASAVAGGQATIKANLGSVGAGGANFYPGPSRSFGTTALYDPVSNAWSDAANIGERSLQAATLLANGKVLITGGYDATIASGLSTAALYDPSTNSVTQEPNLPNIDYGQNGILLENGAVLITGGVGISRLYSP